MRPFASIALLALPAPALAASVLAGAHHDAAGRVQVDVHYDCRLQAPLAALAAAGLTAGASARAAPYCVVEGWVDPANVAQLSSVPAVNRVSLPHYVLSRPVHSGIRPSVKATGTTTGINVNGVKITRADQFVSQTSVIGTGVTVGVQSSGAASWQTIANRGELPSTIKIVFPAGTSSMAAGDDEGTMLMEEIHAIAPGASLVFCGPTTFTEYTSCLQQLIKAGATILVDDMNLVSDDLMNAGNDETTAVATLLTNNPQVALYTSAGNSNGSYWEGSYQPVLPSTQGAPALSCSVNGVSTTDNYVAGYGTGQAATLTVSGSGASFPLLLAWSDATGQPASHFDLYVYNGSTLAACLDSGDSSINANGHQMQQQLSLAGGSYTVYVASTTAPAGTYVKLWAGGDGLTQITPTSAGSTVAPQAFASGAVSVGAVDGADGVGNTIEAYSSLAPATFPLPTQTQVWSPTLVAPDDINVDAAGTGFTSDLFTDSSGTYPQGLFKGTSASAPQVGGVAALIQAAWPQLSRAQLNQVLESSAVWPGTSGTSGPDATYGYGRVDAVDAAAAAQSLTGSAPAAPQSTASSSGGSSNSTSGSSSGASSGGHSGGGSCDLVSLGLLALMQGWVKRRRRGPAWG